MQWTENYHDALAAAQVNPLVAPVGTKPYTPFAWIIVALMYLQLLSLFAIDWESYILSSIQYPSNPYGAFTPTYFLVFGLNWLVSAGMIVLAYFDWRALKNAGVPSPFHWAFTFLGAYVYLIGRAVVMKRRAGAGVATLWLTIGYFVASVVVTIALFAIIVSTAIQYSGAY